MGVGMGVGFRGFAGWELEARGEDGQAAALGGTRGLGTGSAGRGALSV